MTTPDIAGLCEKLRAEAAALRRWIADRADARTWGGPTMYPPHPITEDNAAPIIANATEAADTLERQADEIERLRSAGAALLAVIDETDSYQKRPGNGDWGVECACCMGELFDGTDRIRINIARAALTGEDT